MPSLVFLRLKSLGVHGLDFMIPRDLMVVYNGLEWMCWEIYVYGMVVDNSSTQSLKHLALDFAVGKNGTRIREKVWCRRCPVSYFCDWNLSEFTDWILWFREIWWLFIMVWICCVERLFMFTDCVYMVRHPISQTSGVRFCRWQEWNADSWVSLVPAMPTSSFCYWNLSEFTDWNVWFREIWWIIMISICYSWSRYCVFLSETRECIAPES
jgi:hypothetical protein